MEMKTTPNFAYIPTEEPKRAFIGTRVEGARGQTLARSGARGAAIKWSRARRFESRAVLSVPCQFLSPVLVLQLLALMKLAS